MANSEHLDILKQGVKVWNKWRKDNPDIIPDLQKAKLQRTNLAEIDLSLEDLQGVNLKGACLQRAIL